MWSTFKSLLFGADPAPTTVPVPIPTTVAIEGPMKMVLLGKEGNAFFRT
jgi:hypothetical protein